LLQHLARAWREDRGRVEDSSKDVAEQLAALGSGERDGVPLNRELFGQAFWQFRRAFDGRLGGFGSAPKFPRPVVLNYLFRFFDAENSEEAKDMALLTLRAMADGGMHDHLGGGFHRYSVDERWFVPHFEKMLYDQAQLATSYLEAFQITQDRAFADVARDIFSYVLRDLTDASGAFYSAEDADSPDPEDPTHSGEGAFYIWRQAEIESLLGADTAIFCARFGVEANGNVEQDPHGEFTGRNILFAAAPIPKLAARFGKTSEEIEATLGACERILLDARSRRPRPHLDNKVLTSWNGLMISALVKGSVVLRDPLLAEEAKRAAEFFLSTMAEPSSGQLLRRFCDGEAAVAGFLDDYAFLAQALLDLFEATGDARYLARGDEFARSAIERFEDPQGGFFSTPEGASDLLMRMKDDYDGAEPSGNSVMTEVCIRLAHLTGNDVFQRATERSLNSFAGKLKKQPSAAPQMLVALGQWLARPEQVVVRCSDLNETVQEALAPHRLAFKPNTTVLAVTDAAATTLAGTAPFLASLERKGTATLYHCRDFTCSLPEVLA
jgi:uncharacterized protein YyaL (SSP411 family)